MSDVSAALAAVADAKAALAAVEESLVEDLVAAKESGDVTRKREVALQLREVRSVAREGRTELVGGDAVRSEG